MKPKVYLIEYDCDNNIADKYYNMFECNMDRILTEAEVYNECMSFMS